MSLSTIKIGKIKFKPNDVSHFYAFVGREGAAGVDPNAINTVAVSLEDGSIIFAVVGASEEKKLVSMQKRIDEEKTIGLLMQVRDEMAAA